LLELFLFRDLFSFRRTIPRRHELQEASGPPSLAFLCEKSLFGWCSELVYGS
jgi:hypothetical protein